MILSASNVLTKSSNSLVRDSSPQSLRLANNSHFIVEQMPVEAVTLSIWLNVGAAVEPDRLSGISHFLEHMIFKGTIKQSVGEFESAIEACGGKTNACTSYDFTNYHITVAPSDFNQLAPRLLDLVVNAAIPELEFDRERQVVLEEIRRSEDNCDRRIYRELCELIYSDLPYSRPVLGNEEVIGALSPIQMRQFHQSWYAPQNIAIACVGGLPVEQMQSVVEQFWTEDYDAKHSENPEIMPLANINRSSPSRHQISDPRLKRSRLILAWRIPGLQDQDSNLALSVLASILGGGRTSRLVKDLKETRGICDRLSVGISSHGLAGSFQIALQLPAENLAIAEQLVIEHIQQIAVEQVLESELEKICTQASKRFIFANETPKQRADSYGYYDRIVGDLRMALDYPQRVEQITSKQIRAVVQQFLSISAMQVLIATPS
jgi:zinc protease